MAKWGRRKKEIKQFRCVDTCSKTKEKTEEERYHKTGGGEGLGNPSETTYKRAAPCIFKIQLWARKMHYGWGAIFPEHNLFCCLYLFLTSCRTPTHKTTHFPQTRCQSASSLHLIACWGQQLPAPLLLCGGMISAFPNRIWLLVFVRLGLLFTQKHVVRELSECFSNTDGTRNIYPHLHERMCFSVFKYMKRNAWDI